jgi:hypothetical protein
MAYIRVCRLDNHRLLHNRLSHDDGLLLLLLERLLDLLETHGGLDQNRLLCIAV